MSTAICEDVQERAFLGRPLPDDALHAAGCAACRDEVAALTEVGATLAADVVAPPDPALARRVLASAAPLLATRRRHAARRGLAAALGAALLPLPLIVLFDVWALGAIYALLTRLLPPTLSFYLVVNYAAVLALLGAVTYGAIPLLAERQARGLREVHHG